MHYKNFTTVTYAPAGYLNDNSIEQIKADIEKAGRYIKLDKIYLSGEHESVFDIHIMPGHYMVFKVE